MLGGSISIINTHSSHKHRADLGSLVTILRLANNFSEVDSAGEIDEAKSEDDSKEDLGHLGEVEDFNNKQIEDYSFEGIKRL